MTFTQSPLAGPPHRNQQLFSDYYLDHLLPQQVEWQALAAEAAPFQATLRALYAGAGNRNEAQTEDDLIKPTLRALGHTFEVQASLRTPGGTKKPDYVFYRDDAALQENKGKTLTEALLQSGALAVGDAKQWDRPLDTMLKHRSGQVLDNTNPAFQISFYMQHSGLAWGILTNGRLWRLYHKDSAYKLDRYYEVDLPDLLERDDPAAFLYFYAFFRRAAFEPGPLALDTLLRASADYAQAVSENLKDQVYTALRHLAQGFLDYAPNGLRAEPDALKAIYDNSLIVLYRLLFVFYAEARELLPVRENDDYRQEYSLDAIKREVARRRQTGAALLPTTTRLWAKLRDLFGIINVGSPPLQVATFNGGLFDPQRHPFLERFSVGDARLQEALDMLARVDGRFIDYRDLQERHLGTIYEGLLEYHLAPADEPGWSVDLLNAKGERHRTGSYYTPEFVVRYIVDQTLGPVLRRAVAGATTDAERIAAVLAVNVCDPSTGSGHFLVAATEYIARFLLNLGVAPQDDTGGEADMAYWKRRVVQSCIYGVDLNPLAVDLAKLSLWLSTVAKDRPLSFLDHHVRCGNALVGARVADVGSAAPIRSAKPSKKEQQARAAGQLSMLDDDAFRRSLSSAVDSLFLIEANPALTVAQVKEQEQVYAALRADLTQRYARLADLHTATRWGLAVDGALWPRLAEYAAGRALAAPRPLVELAEQAQALAATQRFFHWDLEFPEVFFDKHGQPLGARAGFDAVIGNPPYVRQEQLAPLKPYLQHEYQETYAGTADLYVYFVSQGLRLLQQDGLLAYISSNSWLRANYAAALRAYLRTHTSVEQIIDLGDNRVFADAPDVYPAILITCHAEPAADHSAQAATFSRGEGIKNFAAQIAGKLAPVAIHDQADSGWQLDADEGRQLFAKLMRAGKPLGEVMEGRIYYGIKTGLNEAFIIDQATRDRLLAEDASSAAIIKPMLRAEDLRPWYAENEGRWLILIPNGWTTKVLGTGLNEANAWTAFQTRHPSIAEYLDTFGDVIRIRGDKGEFWWELRPCAYLADFDRPKVLSAEIGKLPRYSWDDEGLYVNNKAHLMPCDDPSILGILQSRVLWFATEQLCTPLGERAGSIRYQQLIQFISRLPIPDAPEAEREAIGELAMQITEQAKARYALHQRAQRRILSDLGSSTGAKLNQRLTAWWALDFSAFRTEVQKVFKHDIPLKDRDDWQEWLDARRAEHQQRTATIVRLEIELNARVYALFNLSAAEIAIIEQSTKYQYGEV